MGMGMAAWLRPKSEVEIRSDEEGFRGVWYEAVVVRRRRRRCEILYTSLLSDQDPTKPLRESVLVSNLRPRPPPPPTPSPNYSLHDLVDVFHNDGWWCGVVSSVLPVHGTYKVAFPINREEILAESNLMRPQLHWVRGQWTCDCHEESEHQVFAVGDVVEVSRLNNSCGVSWFAAQVKKVISSTIFLVEYRNIRTDGSDDELLTEIVDEQCIRLPQMLDSCMDFMADDDVEVLIDGGWVPAIVVQLLEGSIYRVKLDYSQEEKEFNQSSVRGGCIWNGLQWVAGKSKRSGSQVKFAEEKQEPCAEKNDSTSLSVVVLSDDSGATCESNSSLSKRKKEEGPTARVPIRILPKSLKMVLSDINERSHNSFILDGCSAQIPKEHEVKSHQTSKRPRKMKLPENDKSLPDNILSDGGSSELLDEHQRNFLDDVHEVPSQEELLQANCSDSSVHLCKDHQAKNLTFNLLEEQRKPDAFNGTSMNGKTKVKRVAVRRPKANALRADEHDATIIINGSSERHVNALENLEESTLANDYADEGGSDCPSNKKSKPIALHHNEETGCEGSRAALNTKEISLEDCTTTQSPKSTAVNLSTACAEGTNPITESGTGTSCEPEKVQLSVNKNGNLVPGEQSKDNMATDNGPFVDTSLTLSSSVPELPFLKSSVLWEVIESMEIFRKLPQKPHFHPLRQHVAEFREGMAIGLMISFANLASSVQKLRADDDHTTIQEKFETLVPLKKNGFNVQCLQLRLQKLLEFQTIHGELESKKSSIVEEILRKNEDNAKLDTSIMALDKSISEIEEKLKKICKERDSLSSQREKNDSEICKMQEELSKAVEAYSIAESNFIASLASW